MESAASLIYANGTLYGTTEYGGAQCPGDYNYGCGTVFRITPNADGAETVLHSFAGKDGDEPLASLIDVSGTLYGTTAFGGANSASGCSFEGCSGTVFSITPSGTEHVLHSFGAGTDGGAPIAALIQVKDKLYGTTAYGGALYGTTASGGTHDNSCAEGCATVFTLSP